MVRELGNKKGDKTMEKNVKAAATKATIEKKATEKKARSAQRELFTELMKTTRKSTFSLTVLLERAPKGESVIDKLKEAFQELSTKLEALKSEAKLLAKVGSMTDDEKETLRRLLNA